MGNPERNQRGSGQVALPEPEASIAEPHTFDADPPAASVEGRTRLIGNVEAGGRRGYVLRRLLAVSDLAALGLSYMTMVGVRELFFDRAPLFPGDLTAFVLLLPLWIALGTLLKLYHVGDRGLDYSVSNEIGAIVLVATVWNWVWLMTTAVADPSSVLEVLPFILLWAASLAIVPLLRALTVSLGRRARWYRQRVLVIGTETDAARVMRRLDRHPEYALDVAAVVAPPDAAVNGAGRASDGEELAAERLPSSLGLMQGASDVEDIVRLAEQAEVSRAIVASTPLGLGARSELIRGLIDSGIQVDVVSGDPDLCSSSAAALHYVEGLPVLTVPSIQVPRTWKAVKHGLDLVAATLGLILLAPFLAAFAIAIKLDSPGPVLFRQRRIGRHGEQFQLLKFRTMVADAEDRKREITGLNMHAEDPAGGRMFKAPGDPRITRVGRFLRRWSLDELPQIWNVFKGEMSIVGPRPLILEESTLVEGRYEVRLEMRPGITGPWQTLGRSDIGFEDMVKLDYTYVMNWTLGEDFKLIIRTLGAVARGRGAY